MTRSLDASIHAPRSENVRVKRATSPSTQSMISEACMSRAPASRPPQVPVAKHRAAASPTKSEKTETWLGVSRIRSARAVSGVEALRRTKVE